MLLSMSNPSSRGVLFTLMTVASFMVGCGGLFEEGTEPRTAFGPSQEEQAQPAQEQQAQETYQEQAAVDTTAVGYDDTDPSALTEFRAELDPYGAWVDDPVYGTVWIPSESAVGSDFEPYVSSGHWGYTEEGDWLWVSDYSWGWVAFHYGRWVWIPARGWSWIPGRRYAPAWVVWRTGDPGYDYVGWAPMPPYYYWTGGVAVGLWIVPPTPYVFCHSSYVFYPHVHEHIVAGPQVGAVASHTSVYAPAHPTMGGAAHSGGTGGPGRSYNPAMPTRGPTLTAAHVPQSSAPHTFASPPPRAIAAASSSGRIPSATSWSNSSSRSMPAYSQSASARAMSPSASMSHPVYRGGPTQVQPRPGQSAYNRGSGFLPSPYYGPSGSSAYRPSGGAYPSAPSGYHPSASSSGGFHPSGGYAPSGSFHPSTGGFSSGGSSFHPSSSSGGFSGGGGFHSSAPSGGFAPSSKPSSSGGGHSGGGHSGGHSGGHR
jgi:hypothetical protein